MLKKILVYFFITFFLLIAFAYGVLISVFNNQIIDFAVLDNIGKPSILLDDEGNEWGKFELDKRGNAKYQDFPKHLIQAFLAAEDRQFFNHTGLSFKGIIRSTIINLWNRRVVQGASTITQQLVKLLFFDSKKTFKRKIKEQFFALIVEKQYSKEQIMQLYLNNIYFGCGIYGVQAAAQRFFGKSIQEISIQESACLSAVVKSPINYCPLLSYESNKKRRDLILSMMHKLNFINDNIYKEEKDTETKIKTVKNENIAPHLKETIRIYLEEKLGKHKLYFSGLKIQTTLNAKIQKVANQEFNQQFTKLKKELKEDVDGALISIDPKTGEVKALIGGYDFAKSKFNRALQAKRQMGSIFKPIVYAAAIERGLNFSVTEIDEPIEVEYGNTKWSPNNNTKTFEGRITLAKALSFSKNTIAVKLLLRIGVQNIINLAKKFRVSENLNPYPSLALGCIDSTLIQSAAAFNVFNNGGTYVETHFIKWVKDEFGVKIFRLEPYKETVLNSRVTDQVAKVLSIGIKRYVDRMPDKNFEFSSFGKTGTTNQSRTCWFCGAVPNLTTSIYIGCDDPKSLGYNIYPVTTVFPIWYWMHKKLNLPDPGFSYDPSLREINIDWNTGELTNSFDSNSVSILV